MNEPDLQQVFGAFSDAALAALAGADAATRERIEQFILRECYPQPFRTRCGFTGFYYADPMVLPPHLADDAPFATCSVCQRKSWAKSDFGSICNMPQPSGRRCPGMLLEKS